jgi:hypothetical protein
MNKSLLKKTALITLCQLLILSIYAQPLERAFLNPPDSSKPWVYWFWLNGNLSKEGITADLEAMKRVGIGGVLIMETDQGTPKGNYLFGDIRWRELFKFMLSEANRLGMEVNMNNDAGWTGSGGPWIPVEKSMQKIVWSDTIVDGNARFEGKLAQPQAVNDYYGDIMVLAFPSPKEIDTTAMAGAEKSNIRIADLERKAFFRPSGPKEAINVPSEFPSLSPEYTVQSKRVLNVSNRMKSDGSFTWNIPEGKWTIFRIGHTTSGKFNHPAPEAGLGYECDKLSKEASTLHFNELIQKLAEDSRSFIGETFVSTHIDSWELGTQNWTPGFYEEFEKRRGYDPVPYIPVMMGIVIDNIEISERFLWDLRTTVSEMMLENYVENISNLAHQNGLRLSIEPYDWTPTNELMYAGRADEPMAEFWSWPKFNYDYSCTEISSAAHVYGKKIIGVEAFTANSEEKWLGYPGGIKELGDWAFCEGINRFVFHRYAMQPYENIRPGVSMGPWGLHYERTQTWWEQSASWHEYLARCQYLLQQGLFVADICYLAPESTPQTWIAPQRRDSSLYNFDGCPAEVVLTRMSVKDGRIVLPDGMNYKLLALSGTETMTPELLRKLKELAEAGATIVGAPPKKACGLSNYPQSDRQIQKLVSEMWGNCDGKTIKENRIGKGRIVYGKKPEEVLSEMKIERDFSADAFLRYTHRNIDGTDVYFVSNPAQNRVSATCRFRVSGLQPEIWDPMTGKIARAACYEETNGLVSVPLNLDPTGSVFVVFRPENKANVSVNKLMLNGKQQDVPIWQNDQNGFEMDLVQPGKYKLITSDGREHDIKVADIGMPMDIMGAWEVQFIDGMGAPETTMFKELMSWSDHDLPDIKYYSGNARYIKNITVPNKLMRGKKKLKLDLGKVEIMAEVKVNGKPLGTLWKAPYLIDITDAVKAGKNTIEITVVNLWVNRLIGDEELPDLSERKPNGSLVSWPAWVKEGKSDPTGRRSFTTWKLWKKDSPLLESGLIGPVKIIPEQHVTVSKND